MRVVHAVVTEAFAGTERYVVDVATAQAALGWDVTVIAGTPVRERLGPAVRWRTGGTVARALRSASALRGVEVAHAHLTYGELALSATARRHGGRVLATRHLATPRGQSRVGGVLRPFIERRLSAELAISAYVSQAVSDGRLPVLHNGVAHQERVTPEASTTVVMAHRLEREKATGLGLAAWFASDLPKAGWHLVVAGQGSERPELEQQCAGAPDGASVTFRGQVRDMNALYADAALLLAPAPAEPLGLTVLEAMARGLPVVAAAGGGHRETLASQPQLLFAPGDVAAAAAALNALLAPAVREKAGRELQLEQREHFDLDRHVAALAEHYRG